MLLKSKTNLFVAKKSIQQNLTIILYYNFLRFHHCICTLLLVITLLKLVLNIAVYIQEMCNFQIRNPHLSHTKIKISLFKSHLKKNQIFPSAISFRQNTFDSIPFNNLTMHPAERMRTIPRCISKRQWLSGLTNVDYVCQSVRFRIDKCDSCYTDNSIVLVGGDV